ncbi:hypothetical protein [Fodinicola feengrottensis]|uniref:Uncharacterized protein n=1 Tax=Fodinicola feengrottensis TaxID=435914 RepID=A0ABN2HGZ1_9ACTN|nr:hypothetical protein [Fodinicola feengrottensis]
MLPTLFGRIQIRIVLLLVVGGFWTTLLTPILPGLQGSIGLRYATTYMILVTTIVVGILWELLYHLLMQFRWEKDWPTFFGLVTIIPEGLLIWGLLKLNLVPFIHGPDVPLLAFIILFVIVWIAQWLTANGPLRVPFVRWRFRGGRFV